MLEFLHSTWAVFRKELISVMRDPLALLLMFGIPSLQLIIFGFAINTNVTNIHTAVLDLDHGQEARRVEQALTNTGTFEMLGHVRSYSELDDSMRRGDVQVGVIIPAGYTEARQAQEPVQVQMLIDGSNATIANSALQAGTSLGLKMSIETLGERLLARGIVTTEKIKPVVEFRPRLVYNPDLKSSHFYVPGLIGVVLQIIPVFLTAFAIVRERENGTLEQLMVTPLSKASIVLGKLTPYLLVGFFEMAFVILMMVLVFHVPIKGSLLLLIALSTLFILTALAIGLLISTVARSQPQAMQMAYVVMLPSILLSGFVFPRQSMP
ncbi:MAG: ABC transporter permease, partial [bacterium]